MRFDGYFVLNEDAGKNVFEHEGIKYLLEPLDPESKKKSKGGNSSVFNLQSLDNADAPKLAIKFSNAPSYITKNGGRRPSRNVRALRFLNEIAALNKAKDAGLEKVVAIEFDGQIELGGNTYLYYAMERATFDLAKYLISDIGNGQIDEATRVQICFQLLLALKDVHSLELYHRDIKPDNVFVFQDGTSVTWKLGDLGLADSQNEDIEGLDTIGEKIGPYGWLSPEVMNKVLTEKTTLGYDCLIDQKSDIFQMGKLFWYVFNYNVPIGHIEQSDLGSSKAKLLMFPIIRKMLEYSKTRRIAFNDLEVDVYEVAREFAII